jgi:hypothetical protein
MSGDSQVERLRLANTELAVCFARFSGGAALKRHEQIQILLRLENTLRCMGALLEHGLVDCKDPETQDELILYRANLLRLQRELNAPQARAITDPARLNARQRHLPGTALWCTASRTTH